MNLETEFDRDAQARDLASLPEEYQPVFVSVSWRDVELGSHLPYQRAGLRTVTSGHWHDPVFLLRLYDLCRQFKYACANEISTSFCMSVLAGCRFFYKPTGPLRMTRRGVTTDYETEPTLHLPGKRACLEASPFPPAGDGREQLRLAERFAGKAFVRPPEFFRELFAECRRRLQSGPPPDVSGLAPGAPPDVLANWLAWGIDADGWAHPRCGLVVPARRGFAGVKLAVTVPARPDPAWKGEWRVTLEGGRTYALRTRPGDATLELPSKGDGGPIKVTVEATSPVATRDGRGRVFKIGGIQWAEKLSFRLGGARPRWVDVRAACRQAS
jgi:hypothetical protein